MKEDNINEFIQESENEANDSEQDFSARNYAPLNKPPQLQTSTNSHNQNQSHDNSVEEYDDNMDICNRLQSQQSAQIESFVQSSSQVQSKLSSKM